MNIVIGPQPAREFTDTEREALLGSCPDCHQPKGEWCVYMPIAMADPYSQRPGVQEKLMRVGTPTKRLHNGRTVQARYRLYRRERVLRQQQNHHAIAASRPDPELLAAYRAGLRADYRDYLTLAAWLRAYGSIFDIAQPDTTEGQ
jgi:hypothetical protein